MKHSNDVRSILVAGLVSFAVACGGGGDTGPDGGGSGTGPATAAEFCDSLYDSFATRYAACSKAPLAWATQFVDKVRLCAGMVGAVDAGKGTYDRSAAGQCLAYFESASCTDLRAVRDDVKYVTACHTAVRGKGASGYPYTYCASDEECASGRCYGAGASCPGYCFNGYGPGATCINDRVCAPGLFCKYPGNTCQPYDARPGNGEECNIGLGCRPGLYCDGSVASVDPGTCKPQVSAGPCPTDPKAMAPGYGCFGGTARQLLGPGETCSSSPDLCGPGLYCGAGNLCTQEPFVGEACVMANGAYQGCIGGYCDAFGSHRCVPPSAAPCYSDWDCASQGYCINGTCQSYCF